MLHWYRLLGAGSEGARALERRGLVAALVPASAQRSVVNAVVYERSGRAGGRVPGDRGAYDEIGAKWTVWVHDGTATPWRCSSGGHVLDASPEAMAVDLIELPPQARPRMRSTTGRGGRAVRRGRDQRPRVRPRRRLVLTRAARLPSGRVNLYVARRDGEAVGCCAIVDDGANAEVQMVAVVPEAAGPASPGT